jgi:hypothetical protein
MGKPSRQTQTKVARERMVRERRMRKLEKKQALALERKERASPTPTPPGDSAADPS